MRSVVGGALLLLGMSALPVLAAEGSEMPAAAASCVPCHGRNGQGQPATGIPRLAGLNAEYLEHQLVSFKDGTRKNRIMLMIASDLSDDERKAIANYYADMTTPKSETAPADQAVIAAGAKIAATGDGRRTARMRAVPRCRRPWRWNETFPASRDNRPSYIEKALRSWKAGDRKNDPMGVMANVANKLTDDQIKSVAAYYESLPVAAPAHSTETKP